MLRPDLPYEPSYLRLDPDEIRSRAEWALDLLGPERCEVCPRLCRVDRLADETGLCGIGRRPVVASAFPHFGEEDCLRGWNGSGTIFFSGCNLRCTFCLGPDTRIATAEGPRRAEDLFAAGEDEVVVGHGTVRRLRSTRVWTSTGELAPVTKVFRHEHRGELIRIEPGSAPALWVTPEHEVLAAHRSDTSRIEKVRADALDVDHRLVIPKAATPEAISELDTAALLRAAGVCRPPSRRRVDREQLIEALHSDRPREEQLVRFERDRYEQRDLTREGSRWTDERIHFLVPIHAIERESYHGPVYNLEVDHPSRSYLAPAVAVGNCQNWDISWEVRGDRPTPQGLAATMLDLQRGGCHNINLVTPEHVVPQILEALPAAIEGGLRLPIIYNTSAYDSLDSLELMDGIVDVYMPDFKVVSSEAARRYLRRADYAEVATAALREMHRQVGPLRFDRDGLAVRGLLIRHLVMPGLPQETEAVLGFIAEELGPDTYVDIMAQYHPAGLVGRDGQRDSYEEINRPVRRDEHLRAVEFARSVGLRRLDPRSVAAGERLAPS